MPKIITKLVNCESFNFFNLNQFRSIWSPLSFFLSSNKTSSKVFSVDAKELQRLQNKNRPLLFLKVKKRFLHRRRYKTERDSMGTHSRTFWSYLRVQCNMKIFKFKSMLSTRSFNRGHLKKRLLVKLNVISN